MTKLRVRVGSAEAEVEADDEHLREAIDLIPELASKLPQGTPTEVVRSVPGQEVAASAELGTGQLPLVAVEKGDSLADVVEKFFADSWGRDRRKLSDVRTALQSYGLNYPKQSVAVALLRLAKTTKIRRFKGEDGEYVYTGASMLLPQIREPVESELVPSQPN